MLRCRSDDRYELSWSRKLVDGTRDTVTSVQICKLLPQFLSVYMVSRYHRDDCDLVIISPDTSLTGLYTCHSYGYETNESASANVTIIGQLFNNQHVICSMLSRPKAVRTLLSCISPFLRHFRNE